MGLRLSTAARNDALATGTETWLDSTNGRLAIYTGAQPTNGGDAMTGTLLATWSVASISAPASGSMTITFAAATVAAAGTGTAQSFVLYLSTETAVTSAAGASDNRITGTVGTSGTDLILDSTSITSGQNITISSATLTQPAS